MSFLRKLFGPNQKEVWGKLCEEIGADYCEGGFWKGDKVVARIEEWSITLDTFTVSSGNSSVTYTRMRAPFVNRDGFRFTIYREGIFSKIGKFFGMQDVEIGIPEFDDSYIIKGTDEDKLRVLFADTTLRDLIHRQPDIYLSVKDDEGWFGPTFPEGVDELYFQVVGVVKDLERLKTLYGLFSIVLHRLCHMGSAYENDPGMEL